MDRQVAGGGAFRGKIYVLEKNHKRRMQSVEDML